MRGIKTWAALGVAVVCVASLVGWRVLVRLQHGPPQADMHIDAMTRNAVLDGVVANLKRAYVFPQQAAVVEAALRQQRQDGVFDGIDSAVTFADTLSDTLQALTHDKHLELRYFAEVQPPPRADGEPSDAARAEELLHHRRLNFGFETVGRLPFNLGYIDLHSFARPQDVPERIAAAMTLLADTDALIIDLRRCGGGDPESVMLFASYLFDAPTHLNDVYYRDEDRTDVRWTTATVPGRKYGSSRQIVLLTGEDTFSGCEDLAYALKNAGRATLVGVTTGGGAHAGSPAWLGDHFSMFVPSGRPINPVTHTDWERVGVTPDTQVAEKKALEAAQAIILTRMAPGETDPERREMMQRRIAELR